MNITENSPRQPIRLRNVTCAYCASELHNVASDEDHVIGRRFVPKGKLQASWNLIVRSCIDCNRRKSELEDDLSAISMQPGPFGDLATEDPVLKAESERKAKTKSRHTGKPVHASKARIQFAASLGPGVDLGVTFSAPPQVTPERAAELARLQLTAFFYWLTYSESSRRGAFWRGNVLLVNVAMRGDWGNSYQVSFANLVRTWDYRLVATTAAGYFRVAIRKHPEALCWSWALEWNCNLRLIGFFGDPQVADALARQLEVPAMTVLRGKKPGDRIRLRSETLLREEADVLFDLPE